MKKKRFQFLERLFNLAEEDDLLRFDAFGIGKQLGFEEELTGKIIRYLSGEELITLATRGSIAITHFGICEVEEALSNPDRPTDHFPPINIINITEMRNSQIQQSSPQATQLVIIDLEKRKELEELIMLLKKSLDELDLEPIKKLDFQSEIQTLEAQMKKSKPNSTIINESFNSIRRIIEGIAYSVLASGLLSKIEHIQGFS